MVPLPEVIDLHGAVTNFARWAGAPWEIRGRSIPMRSGTTYWKTQAGIRRDGAYLRPTISCKMGVLPRTSLPQVLPEIRSHE